MDTRIGPYRIAAIQRERAANPPPHLPPVSLPVAVECNHDVYYLTDARNSCVATFGASQAAKARAELVARLLNTSAL